MTQSRKLVSGFFWLAGQAVARQVMLFAVFIVLGRMLGPAEFGIVAIAMSVVAILQALSSQVISQSIIQRPNLTDEEADCAFTLNLVLCCAFALATVMGSAALAMASSGNGQLALGLAVLAGLLPIYALYEIHQARLSKGFQFARIAQKKLYGQLAASIMAVGMALAGFGLWALVAQYYAMAVTELVVVRRWSPWRARWRWHGPTLRSVLRFSGPLVGARIASTIEIRSPELVFGFFFGQSAAGFFRVARNLFDTAIGIVGAPLLHMALPILSDAKDKDVRRKNYYFLSGLSAWLFLPPFIMLGIWANDITVLLLGEKWRESGWITSVLAVQGIA
ncbi:MAG: oligosaccharide flippase family protein, partial [Beijerinckiaceae bacterium]